MMTKFYIMAMTSALLLTGCASQTGWTPTVDPYNDRNAYRIPQDTQECKQLASQASGGLAKQTAMGTVVGGALGAATGAAVGAFTGNAAGGAIAGAAIGGGGGALKEGFSSEDQYKNAFKSCMRQRGHNVLN